MKYQYGVLLCCVCLSSYGSAVRSIDVVDSVPMDDVSAAIASKHYYFYRVSPHGPSSTPSVSEKELECWDSLVAIKALMLPDYGGYETMRANAVARVYAREFNYFMAKELLDLGILKKCV